MTPITEEDVRHVARLSRLKLSEQEVHDYAQQLGRVLDYIAKLNELDVSTVEPMAHALEMHNVLRDDAAHSGIAVDAALANAPDAWSPFFKVPKVLGEGSGA